MSKLICQMYGFRKELEKNPYECFRRIKDIGFNEIQLDGLRGNSVETIKDALEKAQLKVSSMHVKHGRFINDVDGIIEEANNFNCKEVYLKYIEDEFQVEYGYKFTKYILIKAGKKLIENGFTVGFHSPEYDFNTLVDGQKVMDYICSKEDGVEILPEPDTYWLSVAKENPLEYCKKYQDRISTIHFKDIDTSLDLLDMKENLRECGKGSVDFETLMTWGYKHGIKAFAIEQDYSKTNIYDSMKTSLEYLKHIELKIQRENNL